MDLDYYQIRFADISPAQQEILIAELAEAGYTGFEQFDTELLAYIPEKEYDADLITEWVVKYGTSFSKDHIPDKNHIVSFLPILTGT